MSVATGRLSPKATYVQYGYGQVEPNHLSARRTGQIYAQLPTNKNITLLENGMFAKYDYANKEVNFTGVGEWMLVFNEVKVYRDYETDADFAMKAENYEAWVYNAAGDSGYQHFGHTDNGDNQIEIGVDDDSREYGTLTDKGNMFPRLLKTNVGDIMTTNCVIGEEFAEGDFLEIGADGYLFKSSKTDIAQITGIVWQVARVWNMPDLQRGLKIVRVQ